MNILINVLVVLLNSYLTTNVYASIIGADDRKDIYNTSDARYVKFAESTAAFFIIDKNIFKLPNGDFELKGPSYGEKYNLCENENFYHQPSITHCTAFLIAPDIVLSAGHCHRNYCEKTSFVFNYEMKNENEANTLISKDDVYFCKKIIAHEYDTLDYFIIQLDRKVNRTPLKVRIDGEINHNAKLAIIGHPAGLPKKITIETGYENQHFPWEVLSPFYEPYFIPGYIDVFKGNSGGPLFDFETGIVEGIVTNTSGSISFIDGPNRNCQITNKVEFGQHVYHGSAFLKISAIPGINAYIATE